MVTLSPPRFYVKISWNFNITCKSGRPNLSPPTKILSQAPELDPKLEIWFFLRTQSVRVGPSDPWENFRQKVPRKYWSESWVTSRWYFQVLVLKIKQTLSIWSILNAPKTSNVFKILKIKAELLFEI